MVIPRSEGPLCSSSDGEGTLGSSLGGEGTPVFGLLCEWLSSGGPCVVLPSDFGPGWWLEEQLGFVPSTSAPSGMAFSPGCAPREPANSHLASLSLWGM